MGELLVGLVVGSSTTILGAGLGYWLGYLKDAGERRRRLRAVAATLREDVRRIERELGPRPKDGETPLIVDSRTAGIAPDRAVVRLDAIPPRVHPWFDSVVHQIGEASASAVTLFLQLDTDLHNYGARVQQLRRAQEVQAERQATAELFTGTLTMDQVMLRDKASWHAMLAVTELEAARTGAWTMLVGCHDSLDALEQALTGVLMGRGGSKAISARATATYVATAPFTITGS